MRRDTPSVMTGDERTAFDRDGFVHLRGLLAPEMTLALKQRARAITLGDAPPEARRRIMRDVRFAKGLLPAPADPELAMWKILNPDRFDREFASFLHTPRLVAAMRDLLGEDVLAFLLMFIYRPPGVADADHPFHQDAWYFPFGPHDDCIGVWLPMDDVDAETGSLLVMPGSHRGEIMDHRLQTGVANGGCFEIPDADAQPGAVLIEAKAGDAVLFHSRTWHKAPANRSSRHRRVITVHAASAACRQTGPLNHEEYGFTLVSGRLHEGGLQPLAHAPVAYTRA